MNLTLDQETALAGFSIIIVYLVIIISLFVASAKLIKTSKESKERSRVVNVIGWLMLASGVIVTVIKGPVLFEIFIIAMTSLHRTTP